MRGQSPRRKSIRERTNNMAERKVNEKFEGTLKVLNFKEVKEGQKNHIVLFKSVSAIDGVGGNPEILADKDIWSADDFKEDTEGTAKFEKVWSDDRRFFYALSSWGGKEKGAAKQANRGGGYTPKSKDEVHAPSVCGIIKSAYESAANQGIKDARDLEAHIRVGLDCYVSTMKVLGGGS